VALIEEFFFRHGHCQTVRLNELINAFRFQTKVSIQKNRTQRLGA